MPSAATTRKPSASCNAAISLHPNDAGGQFNYGNVLLGLQRLDEAFVAFGKALALDPALAAAELNRGSILMSRKRFEEAIASFDAVIRINRNFAEAHCNRGPRSPGDQALR